MSSSVDRSSCSAGCQSISLIAPPPRASTTGNAMASSCRSPLIAAASTASGIWPSKEFLRPSPKEHRRASNSRPALEHHGEFSFCSSMAAGRELGRLKAEILRHLGQPFLLRPPRSPTPRQPGAHRAPPPRPPATETAATAQTASATPRSIKMNSPPHTVPSSPKPVPSHATPSTPSAVCRFSSRQASAWAR